MYLIYGLPSGSDGKESAGQMGTEVQSLRWEDPCSREWQPTPVVLSGEPQGQRSLAGRSPWNRKESDTPEQ